MAFDQNIYFGSPGTLIILPQPRGDITNTRVRATQQFALGNGEYRTRRTLAGSRQISIGWKALPYPTFKAVQSYDQGHMGAGPFIYLDPGERNMLTVNQSASTSLTNDTSNFTIAGSGQSITTVNTPILNQPRSLAWTFNAGSPASGTSILSLDAPYGGWPGVPVVALRSLTFAVQIQGGGSDAVVSFQLELVWYDATGAVMSTSVGAGVTSAAGSWIRGTVTGAAPLGSAYVRPQVHYTSGASSGSIIYFSQFILNEGTTADTSWVPGTGVYPVTIVSFGEIEPWMYPTDVRTGTTLVLRQDGR